MVNEVMKFENETLGIEFVARECNGRYLFPSAAIIKALGYTNTTDTLNKHVFPEYQFRFRNITGKGGKPTIFLSEPGLYQLIMRSNMPNAIKFQKWVFEYVLPNLRNNGYVVSNNITEEQLSNARRALGISGEKFASIEDDLVKLLHYVRDNKEAVFNTMNEMPNEDIMFTHK